MNMQENPTNLRLPAEEFYFAVLDASSLPHALTVRRDRSKLDFLFESHLPTNIESIQADYLSLGPATFLACGMDRDKIRATPRHAHRLGPAALPDGLIDRQDRIPIAKLNLLRGEFEPASVRSARRRGLTHVLVAVCLGTLLVGVALERRTRLSLNTRIAAEGMIDDLLEEQYGPQTATGQRLATRLTADLRRLRQTRSVGPTRNPMPSDVIGALAGLLAAWPDDLGIRTQRLAMRADGLQLTAWAPETEQADRLVRALGSTPGWQTGARQSIERTRNGAVLTLDLKPEGGTTP